MENLALVFAFMAAQIGEFLRVFRTTNYFSQILLFLMVLGGIVSVVIATRGTNNK